MIRSVPLLEKSFDDCMIANDAIKLGDHSDHGYDYAKDFEKGLKSKQEIQLQQVGAKSTDYVRVDSVVS